MKELAQYFRKDNYAALTGIELLEFAEGKARVKLELTKDHLNSGGSVHGGVLFTLADFAFAVAANSHGTVAVAINSCISFFKAVSTGTLFADAKEISYHPKIASYLVEVTNEQHELIATFQGMVYRKREKLSLE
jgi:acyl-CoA thioesterase